MTDYIHPPFETAGTRIVMSPEAYAALERDAAMEKEHD